MINPISAEKLWHNINLTASKSISFIFAIDYEMKNAYFTLDPHDNCGLFWEIDGIGNKHILVDCISTKDVKFNTFPISFSEYESSFNCIQSHLHKGNSFLANLTAATGIKTNCSFEEIFLKGNSRFKILVPNKFVCFSPEIFVNISADGKISSFPMKGTISGEIADAESTILNDYKESAEHFTIVDFIRSDLSRVATNINVDRLRYIDRINTSKGEILQVSSEISGILPHDWKENLGEIIRQLLPAGSISGAPKTATVEAIREAEASSRGFYTGICGYFDGRELKTFVMIRYIEKNDSGKLYFRSGGGITINSNCKDEYEEVIKKVYLPW